MEGGRRCAPGGGGGEGSSTVGHVSWEISRILSSCGDGGRCGASKRRPRPWPACPDLFLCLARLDRTRRGLGRGNGAASKAVIKKFHGVWPSTAILPLTDMNTDTIDKREIVPSVLRSPTWRSMPRYRQDRRVAGPQGRIGRHGLFCSRSSLEPCHSAFHVQRVPGPKAAQSTYTSFVRTPRTRLVHAGSRRRKSTSKALYLYNIRTGRGEIYLNQGEGNTMCKVTGGGQEGG